MAAVFIMSAKLATLALLRIKLFTNKGCDVTIFGEDINVFLVYLNMRVQILLLTILKLTFITLLFYFPNRLR